ncbi:MAG: TonB-dependent receptor [Deltaproteobacteria bacterium]|nr:TonB-dependent receptor [Deltaproteobacteria bacterium]
MAAVALVGPGRAAADDVTERELLLFDEPQVSAAAKHTQPVREAPAAVTVITKDDIRRFGYRTLAEALRSVRGFYGSSDRNYDYIGVRGFLRPSDYNDRILLLINGHTYKDDIYQTAQVGTEFGIDLEAVERIEVVRGPGSALYGGNALFAVINVVTAGAGDRRGVFPLVEAGSFGRKRGQVTAGHVFDNGLELLASGSVLDLDGQRHLFYPEFADPSTNNGVARDSDADRALNFYASARLHNLSLQGGSNWRDKHIPTGAFGANFNDPDTKSVDERSFADLLYTAALAPELALTTRVFYDRYRYQGTYIYGSGTDRTKNQDLALSHWLGSETRAEWTGLRSARLTVGAEYTYHPGAMQENYDLPGAGRILDDNRAFNTWGVYAQEEFAVLSNLTLVGGLRYDRHYNRVDNISPRAAAIWHPSPATTLKLLYGRAFRPPNLFEQYYAYASTGTISLANAKLEPEQIATYEGVLEQELWGRVRGVLAVYHYTVKDLIDQVQVPSTDPDTVVIQYQNVSAARATGAEFELRVPLPLGVMGRASYSLQETRAAGGRLLSNSPKHLGNAGVAFPLPAGLSGAADINVVGPRDTLQGQRLEPAVVANAHVSYATPIPRLGLTADCYNLFDNIYADPGGVEHVQDRIPQDGFSFRVQLHYGF